MTREPRFDTDDRLFAVVGWAAALYIGLFSGWTWQDKIPAMVLCFILVELIVIEGILKGWKD